MAKREFDALASSYEDLLQDPIRDRFAGKSEFFHRRKRDLIRQFLRQYPDSRQWSYLDLGCGKGELIGLLRHDFRESIGIDPSACMMEGIEGVVTRVQDDPQKIPFEDRRFDFLTTVCVLHHVPPPERLGLMTEVRRVLKPGGRVCVIEHNPWNPATRIIVSRTPVDENAILLSALETRRLLRQAGFAIEHWEYFLYLPESLYDRMPGAEKLAARLPLGGQYAMIARIPA